MKNERKDYIEEMVASGFEGETEEEEREFRKLVANEYDKRHGETKN